MWSLLAPAHGLVAGLLFTTAVETKIGQGWREVATGSHEWWSQIPCEAEDDLEFMSPLPPPPECWDYKYALLHMKYSEQ